MGACRVESVGSPRMNDEWFKFFEEGLLEALDSENRFLRRVERYIEDKDYVEAVFLLTSPLFDENTDQDVKEKWSELAIHLCRKLLRIGNHEEALYLIDKLSEIHPFSFSSLNRLNSIVEEFSENQSFISKVLEYYAKAAQHLIEEGRYSEALTLTNSALHRNKANRKLILLKLRAIALNFISRFHPEEELLFESFFESILDIPNFNLRTGRVTLEGIAFTGANRKANLSGLVTPSIAVVMMEILKLSEKDVPIDREAIDSALKKHGISSKSMEGMVNYILTTL